MNTRVFKEVQRFTQWWIWLLFGLMILGPLTTWVLMDDPGDVRSLISVIGVVLFCVLLFVWMHLKTELTPEHLYFYYVPFVKRKIPWRDITYASVINYGFVGGWGIRIGTGYGTVYNISGKMGLHIKTKSGKEFVIGTQRPDQMQLWLNEYVLNKRNE